MARKSKIAPLREVNVSHTRLGPEAAKVWETASDGVKDLMWGIILKLPLDNADRAEWLSWILATMCRREKKAAQHREQMRRHRARTHPPLPAGRRRRSLKPDKPRGP